MFLTGKHNINYKDGKHSTLNLGLSELSSIGYYDKLSMRRERLAKIKRKEIKLLLSVRYDKEKYPIVYDETTNSITPLSSHSKRNRFNPCFYQVVYHRALEYGYYRLVTKHMKYLQPRELEEFRQLVIQRDSNFIGLWVKDGRKDISKQIEISENWIKTQRYIVNFLISFFL